MAGRGWPGAGPDQVQAEPSRLANLVSQGATRNYSPSHQTTDLRGSRDGVCAWYTFISESVADPLFVAVVVVAEPRPSVRDPRPARGVVVVVPRRWCCIRGPDVPSDQSGKPRRKIRQQEQQSAAGMGRAGGRGPLLQRSAGKEAKFCSVSG